MNFSGLIYNDSLHYLDHLAPLCAELNCPLIICEPRIASLAKIYYPDLQVIEKDLFKLSLPPFVISCYTQPLLEAAFPNTKTQNIWLPHGHSDKGWKSRSFEALRKEKLALVYGKKMIEVMHQHSAYPETIFLGNYRWQYYLKHKNFYDRLINLPKGKNLLYAPTWEDAEGNGSFWNSFPLLANALSSNENLLVKLHPNTLRRFQPEIERLKGRYAEKNHIFFLEEIPPIYPILNVSAGYIGDMSSIGYDFLTFDRPMFFFEGSHLPLHKCGNILPPEQFRFADQPELSHIRKRLYKETFSLNTSGDVIRKEILTRLRAAR